MNSPLYHSIYIKLKEQIENGFYQLNDTLPTEKELSEVYNVSTITVKKALDLLKEDGFIVRKPRKGSIVVSQKKLEFLSIKSKPVLGLITTNFTDFFGTQILRSILAHSDSELNFIVKISYGDPAKEEELIEELLALGIQGLILLPTSSEYTSPKLLELISKDFPIVVIDRIMANLPICNVQTDNFNATKDLTKYLFNHGHKKIGLITSDSQVTTIDERVNGFLSSHIDENIAVNQDQILSTIDSVVPNSTRDISEDINDLCTFIKKNKDMTAMLTTEYNIALLAKSAVEQLNQSIPEDFSIVCFDHPTVNIFDINAFTFTHIKQDQTNIGNSAVQLLLDKIAEPTLIKKISLGYNLIEGQSVRQI
ncbi:hypothetical protein IGI37_000795 [Enterococcus sp. AZ194]|uniref:GntR family transcriptional regulator n=1 Tax=Enterococcus sp. AZ194 TaxID=2774629 RepID=UPI003F2123CF